MSNSFCIVLLDFKIALPVHDGYQKFVNTIKIIAKFLHAKQKVEIISRRLFAYLIPSFSHFIHILIVRFGPLMP